MKLIGIALVISLFMTGGAMAQTPTGQTTAAVTVNEYIDITLGGVLPIDFGNVDPGTSDNPSNPVSNVPQAVDITIEATTNVDTDTYLKGDNWATPATLDISNVLYDDDEKLLGAVDNTTHEITDTTLAPANLATTYPGTANTGYFENVACPCGAPAVVNSVYSWLSVPSGQKAGTYTATTVYIKTVSDGTIA